MKIIYINLESRSDRRSHMESMLNNFNVEYERFSAICPTIDEIKNGKYKNFYEKAVPRLKKYANEPLQHKRAIGVFGCYISHYEIHKSQLNNPEPYIILEDDVIITNNTFYYLNNIIDYFKESKTEWDIIRSLWEPSSTYNLKKFQGVHPESAYSQFHKLHYNSGGTHFSVFKNSQKTLNFLDAENVFSIDSVYATCILNVYHHILDVSLEIELESITDIPKVDA